MHGASSVARLLLVRWRRLLLFAVGRRADPIHVLERPERVAGLRRVDAERGRLLHDVFGYMNTNWLQEFDIPIGPDNNIEPGRPDQGQPTHFYPRRNPFLFTIKRAEGFRQPRR